MTEIDVPFHLLQSRYGDDDDDIVENGPSAATSPELTVPAIQQSVADVAVQPTTQSALDASSSEAAQPEAWGVEEEFYDEDDDDDEIGAALEWADLRDGEFGNPSSTFDPPSSTHPHAPIHTCVYTHAGSFNCSYLS